MKHKERALARRYDSPDRCREATAAVYGGVGEGSDTMMRRLKAAQEPFYPPENEYNVYFGELHGHTDLSDGKVDIDTYFTSIRDLAGLDFAALSDHDHGGVDRPQLFGEKWEIVKDRVKKYYEPGKFTTILAYERDSYPWYTNMIVYYDSHDGEMLRGEYDGEITREELHSYLSRKDILLIPHDTSTLFWGTDFFCLEKEDMTPLIQVYSRYNHSERYDPAMVYHSDCEGGHWQDALERGARMGCVAGSDDHDGSCGRIIDGKPYPHNFPGITGVWARENTLPAIFEALKARRCYGFMGGRITLDFRINGHYMGEEISDEGEHRTLYFKVEADGKLDTVAIVKNGRDYITFKERNEYLFFDLKKERDVDYYYIRARLTDGRYAWSSPIWVG